MQSIVSTVEGEITESAVVKDAPNLSSKEVYALSTVESKFAESAVMRGAPTELSKEVSA